MESTSENDLPLVANIQDVCIPHYGLCFSINFTTQIIEGVTLAFAEPIKNSVASLNDWRIVLDSRSLNIARVELVQVETREIVDYLVSSQAKTSFANLASWLAKPRSQLSFCVEPWSLQMWSSDPTINNSFLKLPWVVCITYTTSNSKENISTLWRKDQDSNPCLFTPGCYINNRSLFPCQDAPNAMATWQCIITAPQDYLALTTGDNESDIHIASVESTLRLHYSYTQMVLPMSTFALAVGKWTTRDVPLGLTPNRQIVISPVTCSHIAYPCPYRATTPKHIRFRLISPPSWIERTWKLLRTCIPTYVAVLEQVLGPYPFGKIDMVLLPRSFASLGFASPSLIFVSQSLFGREEHNLVQLAHELSHAYFGITIGPRNWSEEWLSEGFATFLEDFLHEKLLQSRQNSQEQYHWRRLRALNKYHALKQELEHSSEDLRSLRPMGDMREAGSVPNAAHADKPFLQVHYLKGYFFLHYLASLVGLEHFLKFLSSLMEKYHGCLVTSKDILNLFVETFPAVLGDGGSVAIEAVCSAWLDKATLPPEMDVLLGQLLSENPLVDLVKIHVHFWKNRRILSRKRKLHELVRLDRLFSDVLVMLMDKLLENDVQLSGGDLEKFASHYQVFDRNAEVLHRWYELTIRHRYKKALPQLRQFLHENQAMGAYLYGELILTENYYFQQAAVQAYKDLEKEFEPSLRRMVGELVLCDDMNKKD